jgi:NitT/TauT family transport system substrate-binding protein
MKRTTAFLAAAAFAAGLGLTAPAVAADKLTVAVPGIPPVFGGVVVYVARDAGIFKKYDLDVTVKAMGSGAAAAKAVDSGSLDAALSPSQFVVTMISNAGVPLKAIWGMDNPDWLIGSMDAAKTGCDGMKGQPVGVDSPQGARWIQLNTFLVRKCKLAIEKDVPTVPMSSNVGTAMASGQINFGVLHIDDVPVIERMSGKKVHTVVNLEDVSPGIHYLMMIARADNIGKKRDAFVRFVAAMREAADYMHDPKNLEAVAKMAAPTKRDVPDAKYSITAYSKMMFWPKGTVGLDKARLDGAIKNQVAVGQRTKGRGGINPEKTPVTVEQLTDLTLWADAEKLKK